MTEYQLAFLVLMFLIFTAVASVCWLWHESGDMVDEVDEESEPLQAMRRMA